MPNRFAIEIDFAFADAQARLTSRNASLIEGNAYEAEVRFYIAIIGLEF
jgi:hypothetical protein